MLALIDGDIVAYRCAASCEKRDKEGNLLSLDPPEIAIARADKLMREIQEAIGSSHQKTYLSGGQNFRYEVDPLYKIDRKNKPDPVHREILKEFLVVEWKASITDGYEADDALGIAATSNRDSVICSLDKDLLQVPGKHYQWPISTSKWEREARYVDISYMDGLYNFYISSLVGDRSDSIIGVDGLGPVRSAKALNPCTTEQEMFDVCHEKYSYETTRFLTNLKLLWIWRKEGDIFNPVERGLIVRMDSGQDSDLHCERPAGSISEVASEIPS